MKFEFPRASAFEKEIKKLTCESKLVAGGTYQVPIQYESQLDDKNQHIVSLRGLLLGDILQIKLAVVESMKKNIAKSNIGKKEESQKQSEAEAAKVVDEINSFNSMADKMYAEASAEDKKLLDFFKIEKKWVGPASFCGSSGCDEQSEKYEKNLETSGWSFVYARDQKGSRIKPDDATFTYGRWMKK